MLKPILVTLLFFLSITSFSQNPWELGGEYMRFMGTGYKSNVAGARYETFHNKTSFCFGLTYHFSPKSAYSGFKGFGMYAGIRENFGNNESGSNPFIGLRVLFSFENFDGKTNLNSLFFTPMAEAGYHFVFSDNFFVAPSVGYGYTIKITKEYNSREDDTGGRVIPALSAGLRFNSAPK
jgi:hypothetical protein